VMSELLHCFVPEKSQISEVVRASLSCDLTSRFFDVPATKPKIENG